MDIASVQLLLFLPSAPRKADSVLLSPYALSLVALVPFPDVDSPFVVGSMKHQNSAPLIGQGASLS